MTLQRTQSDSEGAVSVVAEQTVPAHIRSTQPQDLVAAGTAEVRVIVSPSLLGSYGIPKTDDRIYIHGVRHNVQTIAPIYHDGELVRVNLLCRG